MEDALEIRNQTRDGNHNGSRRVVAPQCSAPELGLRCYHAQGKDWDTGVEPEKKQDHVHNQILHRLVAVTVFCLVFMVVEVAGGIYARSLAILTDAAHLMSDVASFLIALAALWATSLRSSDHHSYGYHRAEIIGALFSVVLVWIVTAGLVIEAVRRLIEPHEVNGFVMFVIACCGVGVNITMAIILHGCGGSDMGHLHGHSHGNAAPPPEWTEGHIHPSTSRTGHGHSHGSHHHPPPERTEARAQDVEGGHGHSHGTPEGGSPQEGDLAEPTHRDPAGLDPTEDAQEATSLTQPLLSASEILRTDGTSPKSQNMNLRGAAIHVLGDLVQSVGVAVAGALIWWKPHWVVLDPICTFLFSILVVLTTKNITRDIFDVLMERVPRHINMEELGQDIVSIPGVKSVHDLHVWSLTLGRPLMSTHLDVMEGADPNLVLDGVQQVCQSKWGLSHTTIQIDNHNQ